MNKKKKKKKGLDLVKDVVWVDSGSKVDFAVCIQLPDDKFKFVGWMRKFLIPEGATKIRKTKEEIGI